jgi:predicted AlkP superfamily pyrophosphatase or phosphodiesterase
MARASALLVLLLGLTACAQPDRAPSPVVLISFDGFRADYLQRHPTPEMQRLIARGARAEAMIPPFPSKTFPSHYTTVTGLYPVHHGIVANTMVDTARGARFSLADRAAVEDERWWGGEPIWVTGEKQGHVTASLFWPGSEGKVQGIQPRYWARYDASMTHEAEVQQALAWLDQPPADRPVLVALYFNDTDDAGHRDGPDAASVGEAIERLDRVIGQLRVGLEARGLDRAVNIVVTSDHGMAEVSPERQIFLDDYVDVATLDVVDWSPVLMMSAKSGDHAAAVRRLAGAHPQLTVSLKEDLPARLHFRDSPRITPIVGLAAEGWTITTRGRWAKALADGAGFSRGAHGYDNALPSMHGILIAAGPAFREGVVIPPVESVHVYEMLCRVLGFTPADNDGDPRALDGMMSRSGGDR